MLYFFIKWGEKPTKYSQTQGKIMITKSSKTMIMKDNDYTAAVDAPTQHFEHSKNTLYLLISRSLAAGAWNRR